MRVQIALDAARGLEYIHEHTKAHYVHRDIKTSNILLDASFKAKVMINLHDITYFLYVDCHLLLKTLCFPRFPILGWRNLSG